MVGLHASQDLSNINLSFVDILLEFAALILIKILGDKIDVLRGDDARDADAMRTEWWWTGAIGSMFCCFWYSIYLLY